MDSSRYIKGVFFDAWELFSSIKHISKVQMNVFLARLVNNDHAIYESVKILANTFAKKIEWW